MEKTTLGLVAGLAAVFGLTVGLAIVAGSALPLIGTPLLAVTAAIILLTRPRASTPEGAQARDGSQE